MKEYYSHEWDNGVLALRYHVEDSAAEIDINGGVLMGIVDNTHQVNMIRIQGVKHLSDFKFRVIGVTTDCDSWRSLADSTTVSYEIDLDSFLKDGFDLSYSHE